MERSKHTGTWCVYRNERASPSPHQLIEVNSTTLRRDLVWSHHGYYVLRPVSDAGAHKTCSGLSTYTGIVTASPSPHQRIQVNSATLFSA